MTTFEKLCKANVKMFKDPNYTNKYSDGYGKFEDLEEETQKSKKYFIKMNKYGFCTYDSQNGYISKKIKDWVKKDSKDAKEIMNQQGFMPNATIQRAYVSGLMDQKTFEFIKKFISTEGKSEDKNTNNKESTKNNTIGKALKVTDENIIFNGKLIIEGDSGIVFFSADNKDTNNPRFALTKSMRIEDKKIKDIRAMTNSQGNLGYCEAIEPCKDKENKIMVIFIDTKWGRKTFLYKYLILLLKEFKKQSEQNLV